MAKRLLRPRLNHGAFRKFVEADRPQSTLNRRQLLIGAASAAAVLPFGSAMAASLLGAGLTVRSRRNRSGKLTAVQVSDGEASWSIDTALFAGRPTLEMESGELLSVIRLKNARLPGTRFAVDFEAEIRPSGREHSLLLKFNQLGQHQFSCSSSAPLEKWLKGKEMATFSLTDREFSQVFSGDPLTHSAAVTALGAATLTYRPDGSFKFTGPAELLQENGRLPIQSLDLRAVARCGSTLISGRTRAATELTFRDCGVWTRDYRFRTEHGWELFGNQTTPDTTTIEAHEGLGDAFVLSGLQGLTAKLEHHLAFPVERAHIASLSASSDVAASLDLADEPVWLHHPGLSLLVAPQADNPMLILSGRNGKVNVQENLEARRVVPHIEDAVVSIPDAETPSPLHLEFIPRSETSDSQVKALSIAGPITVVRREDFLNLTFSFTNLAFSSGGGGPMLVPNSPGAQAQLSVTFPPQAFAEDYITLPTGSLSVLGRAPSGPTTLVFSLPASKTNIALSLRQIGGLLDWSQLTQVVAPEALTTFGPSALEWRSSSQITIGSATDRRLLAQNSSPSPLLGRLFALWKPTDVSGDSAAVPPDLKSKTFIEMPSLIQLSPNETAAWFHSFTAENASVDTNPKPSNRPRRVTPPRRAGNSQGLHVQPPRAPSGGVNRGQFQGVPPAAPAGTGATGANFTLIPDNQQPSLDKGLLDALSVLLPANRFVLWHTQLGIAVQARGGRSLAMTSDDGKWSYYVDLTELRGPVANSEPRHPHVRVMTGLPGEQLTRPAISSAQRAGIQLAMTTAGTAPFIAERLMLTSLGGYLKGSWHANGNEPSNSSVVSWRHLTTLGRDHLVRIEQVGYLYPTGHPATRIEITRREFVGSGPIYAVLVKKAFLIVSKPTVPISATEQLSLGFQQITCVVKETSVDPQTGASTNYVTLNGQTLALPMRGMDMEGKEISWRQPVAFIPRGSSAGTKPSTAATPSDVNGQSISFGIPGPIPVPAGGDFSGQPPVIGGTEFPCQQMTLEAVPRSAPDPGLAPFVPVLTSAQIRVSALEQMQGDALQKSEVAIGVIFADIYKTNGFGGSNTGEILFKLSAPITVKYGDISNFGGMVDPSSTYRYISRKFGPLADAPTAGGISRSQFVPNSEVLGDSDLWTSTAGGGLVPQDMLAKASKLLGAVSVWDLLPDSIPVAGDGRHVPKIVVSKVYGTPPQGSSDKPVIGMLTTFSWNPFLGDWAPNGKAVFVGKTQSWQSTGGPAPFPAASPANGVDYGKSNGKPVIPQKQASLYVLAQASYVWGDPGAAAGAQAGFNFKVVAGVYWFRIDAIAGYLSILYVDVQQIEFSKVSGQAPKFLIDIPQITFVGPLKFVETIEKWLGGKGNNSFHSPGPDVGASALGDAFTSIDPNLDDAVLDGGAPFVPLPFVNLSSGGIQAGFTLTIPSIGVGAFALNNLVLLAQLNLPFLGGSMSLDFDFSSRDHPFSIAVYGITGGGFFGISVAPAGILKIEASLEFGVSASMSFGIASGSVSLMAGIYFKYDSTTDLTELSGFVNLNGSVSVLGIASVSLTVSVSLTWESHNPHAITGSATVTLTVSLFCFHKSFEIGITKTFQGGGSSGDSQALMADAWAALAPGNGTPLPFTAAVTQTDWNIYCDAFGDN